MYTVKEIRNYIKKYDRIVNHDMKDVYTNNQRIMEERMTDWLNELFIIPNTEELKNIELTQKEIDLFVACSNKYMQALRTHWHTFSYKEVFKVFFE